MSETRVAASGRRRVTSAQVLRDRPTITADGSVFITPSEASRLLADAGVAPLDTGRRLRKAVHEGRIAWLEVHPRSGLYSKADVLAEAERYRSA